MRDPLVLPFLAIVAGILVVRWQPFTWTELSVCLFAGVVGWSIGLRAKWRVARLTGTTISFLALGALLATWRTPPPSPAIDFQRGEVLLVSGCVVEPPVFSAGREQLTLELEPGARMKVTLPSKEGLEPPRLEYGQWIEFPARLRQPHNFGNPGSFDYAAYLARRDIYWQGTASGPVKIEQDRDCGTAWRAALYRLRAGALQRLEQLYAGDVYRTSMMKALLVGDSSGLETAWTEYFRRTGTYHALVISGAHITALAGTFLLLLRIVRAPEMTALAITAILAWVYAFVAGAEPPVTRSAAGFTFLLLTKFFYRRVRLLNLLALVGFAFVLWDPDQIVEASFQLSFLSVAALGAFALPLIQKTTGPYSGGLAGLTDAARDLHYKPAVAGWRVELRLWAEAIALWTRIPQAWILRGFAAVLRVVLVGAEIALSSAVIQISLALPMVEYFHRLSITGLTANVIATPMLTLAVPVGFLAIFTGSALPAWIAGVLLGWSQAVVEWHAQWEPNWRVPDPPFWLAAAFLAATAAAAVALRRSSIWGWPAGAATLASLGLILAAPAMTAPARSPELEITAIDVGQGESLLLSLPAGQRVLVDGGGIPVFGQRVKPRMEIGEDVVSPYLWTRGIRRIDVVAMTHAHDDHCGGLPAVIRNFRPRELWTGAIVESPEWLAVQQAALEAGTRIVTLKEGTRRDLDGVQFHVLAPARDYRPAAKPRNLDSMVLRLTYGRRSILLTGDAEIRTLMELHQSGQVGQIDVLKAAHHGSRTSNHPTLLNLLRPSVALISAGYENSYNLPHPDVIQHLREARVLVLRTDQQGAVTVRTNGRYLEVDTAHGTRLPTFDPFGLD